MRGILLFASLCIWLLHAEGISMARAEPATVDVALVLAIDISASVDADEHRLQMTGLAAALQDEALIRAIAAAPHKRIAIAVTQWSGTRTQFIVQPWAIVEGKDSARDLSRRLLLSRRADSGGGTSISAALTHAAGLFAFAPRATRQVIDLSTDGINNIGPPLDNVRRQLGEQKITVNALAIAEQWPKLADYLDENVITGPAAFAITAKTFDDFGSAMLVKLLREIRGPGLT